MDLLDIACSERSKFAKLNNICKFSLDEVFCPINQIVINLYFKIVWKE